MYLCCVISERKVHQTHKPLWKTCQTRSRGDFPLDVAVLNVVFALAVRISCVATYKRPQISSVGFLNISVIAVAKESIKCIRKIRFHTFRVKHFHTPLWKLVHSHCKWHALSDPLKCPVTVTQQFKKMKLFLVKLLFPKRQKSSHCTSRLKCIYISVSDIIQLYQHR